MLVVKELVAEKPPKKASSRNGTSRTSTSSDSSNDPGAKVNRQSTLFRRRSSSSTAPLISRASPSVYACPARDVRACCVSHNGSVALTAFDSKVGVWNTLTGARTDYRAHAKVVSQVAVAGDGSVGASASVDGSVRVFETDTLKEVAQIRLSGFPWAHGVALSADGQTVFASFISPRSEIGCIVRYRWNGRNEKPVKLWTGHARVFAVYCSHDGSRILFTRGGGLVQVMDVAKAAILCSFEYMFGEFDIAFDAGGRHIVIADRHFAIHSVEDGNHSKLIIPHYVRRVSRPRCDITGNGWYVLDMQKKGIVVRNALTGSDMITLAHSEKLKLCRISADGARVVAVTGTGSLVVWTPDTLVPAPVAPRSSGSIPDFLKNDAPKRGSSAAPWFTNSKDESLSLLEMGLPPLPPRIIDPPQAAYPHLSPLPYPAPGSPKPLPPIEGLLRDTLDLTTRQPLSRDTLRKVIQHGNVKSLAALFAGHNLLLLALRTGVIEAPELKTFDGVPFFFFSELYQPFYSQLQDQTPEGQLLAKKIFTHAEHLGFVKGEGSLSLASATSPSRGEMKRVDAVLQDLCARVGALELTSVSVSHHLSALTRNLSGLHDLLQERVRLFVYPALARCLLSLLPIVGGARSASEVLLQMSASDLVTSGVDPRQCVIGQVANVDASNIQVLRYAFSEKGLAGITPDVRRQVQNAAADSRFGDAVAVCDALEREIGLTSAENVQLHMLDLTDWRWSSNDEKRLTRSSTVESEPASSVASAASAVYEQHIPRGETMSYDHAKIHIASFLQLRGLRESIDDDAFYDVLESKTGNALRVDKEAFVASCDHFAQEMDKKVQAPREWTSQFLFAAAPQTELSIRQAANVLLGIWDAAEDKSRSMYRDRPDVQTLRGVLREGAAREKHIDVEEFVKATQHVMCGRE